MRVARFKEASEKAPTQTGAHEATLIRDGAPLDGATRRFLADSGAPEAAPIEDFRCQPLEDIEDGGLHFTVVYKKGCEVE
jgi:hypothetical protein